MGEVIDAGLNDATLPDANVQRCMLDVLRSASFDPPGGAAELVVVYPLQLAH